MVQNWFLSYRIVINSINMGIKESDCFGWRVGASAQYANQPINPPYAPINTTRLNLSDLCLILLPSANHNKGNTTMTDITALIRLEEEKENHLQALDKIDELQRKIRLRECQLTEEKAKHPDLNKTLIWD